MSDYKSQIIPLPSRSIAEMMKVDLVCGQDGKTWIIHEKTLPGGLNWVEYDAASGIMTLVNEGGHMFDLGLSLPESMREVLEHASEITAIRMRNGRIARSQTIPLIIQSALN